MGEVLGILLTNADQYTYPSRVDSVLYLNKYEVSPYVSLLFTFKKRESMAPTSSNNKSKIFDNNRRST